MTMEHGDNFSAVLVTLSPASIIRLGTFLGKVSTFSLKAHLHCSFDRGFCRFYTSSAAVSVVSSAVVYAVTAGFMRAEH